VNILFYPEPSIVENYIKLGARTFRVYKLLYYKIHKLICRIMIPDHDDTRRRLVCVNRKIKNILYTKRIVILPHVIIILSIILPFDVINLSLSLSLSLSLLSLFISVSPTSSLADNTYLKIAKVHTHTNNNNIYLYKYIYTVIFFSTNNRSLHTHNTTLSRSHGADSSE
jgi:hypothetical protein